MENIIKLINEKRKLKASSLKAYKQNIKKLAQELTGKDFLLQFNKVKKHLETKKLTTKKNYISIILVLLRLYDDKYDKLIKKYTDYLNKVRDTYDEELKNQTKSIKENKNWMPMAELKTKVMKYWTKKVRDNSISRKSKKVLTNKQKRILKAYLVASLYLLDPNNHPPRRNIYASLKLIKKEDYDKLSEKEKDDHNWLLLISRNHKKFIFNNQKNKKEHTMRISPAINSVLNLYLSYHDSEDFLLNSKGQKMTSNGLTKFLTSIFEKAVDKHISTTMLRKIFVSDKYDLPALKEMEKTAKDMGHTIPTQMKHYYKSDNKDKEEKEAK